MTGTVDLQVADPGSSVPSLELLTRWAEAAAGQAAGTFELSVRVVGPEESRRLNETFRGRKSPTNVLAFPADLPAEVGLPLLGDLVICRQIVEREAEEQGKSAEAHWAHMVVHGTLHLLGFDHQSAPEALRMESREVQILASLGYADPYRQFNRDGPSAPSTVL